MDVKPRIAKNGSKIYEPVGGVGQETPVSLRRVPKSHVMQTRLPFPTRTYVPLVFSTFRFLAHFLKNIIFSYPL